MAITGNPFFSPLPEHSTRAGALLGGALDSVKLVARSVDNILTGEIDVNTGQAKPEKRSVSRGTQLRSLKTGIEVTMDRHMLSVKNPKVAERWNAALSDFRGGDKNAFAHLPRGTGHGVSGS